MLTVFDRVFVNLTLCTTFYKISLLMSSMLVLDAKLHSASNNDSFEGGYVAKIWEFGSKYYIFDLFFLGYRVHIHSDPDPLKL
jgi:hypothetical protein